MRLTGQFAVTAVLVAALAALPLARLWAVAGAFGDPLSRQLAEWLAIAGAALLLALFVLLRVQMLKPLAAATATLRGETGGPFQPEAPHPSTRLRDLAALVEAVPGLRRSQADLAELEGAVQKAREELAAETAAFEARSLYLRSLAEAIPLPLALRDPAGRDVLANCLWGGRAHAPELHAKAIADTAGQPIGELLCDAAGGGAAASGPGHARTLEAIAVLARSVDDASLGRNQRKLLQRIIDTATRAGAPPEAAP